jgi:hypothetical protein
MNIDAAVAHACERIPGMIRGALVFLPDGFIIAGVGDDDILDLEPLIRAAARCLAASPPPVVRGVAAEVTEYLFVVHDQLVAIQRSTRDPRLALAVSCTHEYNPAFALGATRLAMKDIEASVDLSAWGL